jgi:NADP-dependent 3-hydroxy acid dehydrogenase YdfG
MSIRGTAIVTGAGTGIGKAVAAALLKNGWNTVFVGRRKDKLDEAVAEAVPTGTKALAVACDVTKPEEVDALFAQVVATFGRVDLLFNNAGKGNPSKLIDEIPVELWNEIVAVNLTGSFLCARAAFAAMRKQSPQGGRIINNGSISAHAPRPGSVPYTATKHAITGLTKTLGQSGRAAIRHRLRPDRYRQCADRHGGGDDQRRAAGQWHDGCGRGHGRAACGQCGCAHGQPAAGSQRAVHECDGDQNAVCRKRLRSGATLWIS